MKEELYKNGNFITYSHCLGNPSRLSEYPLVWKNEKRFSGLSEIDFETGNLVLLLKPAKLTRFEKNISIKSQIKPQD